MSRIAIDKLRAAGHSVVAIAETNSGAPDRDVLAAADSAHQILITEDQDFGELVVRYRLPVMGVILLELDRLSNAPEAQRLTDVVTQLGGRLAGNILVVEPARVRIRPLHWTG